ncbi:hypothetical protein [Aliamphritea spongicola]|nr:hypothetical protein [Aliamphritea spongicola]
MKIKSLKTRMILAFSGFSILLALFYWLLLALFLVFSEDTIFNQQLSIELKRQQTYYTQRGKFDQLPTGMSIYLGDEINSHPDADTITQLPPALTKLKI